MLQLAIAIAIVYWVYRSWRSAADRGEDWAARLEDKSRRIVKIIREKPPKRSSAAKDGDREREQPPV